MTDLPPMTALGASEPDHALIGPFEIAENAALAFASLAVRRSGTWPAPFGLSLPEAGRFVAGHGADAFWIGRGQWMIIGEGMAETDFATAVKAEAPGCSITEQTDGFVCFEVSSRGMDAPLEALLSKLVNIDPRKLTPSSAFRTGLGHMTVFVVRRSERRIAFIGMRTLAGSLWFEICAAAERLRSGC